MTFNKRILLILGYIYITSTFALKTTASNEITPIYDCTAVQQKRTPIPPRPDCSTLYTVENSPPTNRVNVTIWDLNEEYLPLNTTKCTKVTHIANHQTYWFFQNKCIDTYYDLDVSLEECVSNPHTDKTAYDCSSIEKSYYYTTIYYNNATQIIHYEKTTGIFNFQGSLCNAYKYGKCITRTGILFYNPIKVDLCIATVKYTDECIIKDHETHIELICFQIGSRFIVKKDSETFLLNPPGCKHEYESTIKVVRSNEGSLLSYKNNLGHHITDLDTKIITNRYPKINKLSEVNSKVGLITSEVTLALTNISDLSQLTSCENRKLQWEFAASVKKSNELLAIRTFLNKENIIGYINLYTIYYKECKVLTEYNILNDIDYNYIHVQLIDGIELWVNPNTSIIISDTHNIKHNPTKKKLLIQPTNKISKYTLSNIDHLNTIEFSMSLSNNEPIDRQGSDGQIETASVEGKGIKWGMPPITSYFALDTFIYIIIIIVFCLLLQFFLCMHKKFKFQSLPSERISLP